MSPALRYIPYYSYFIAKYCFILGYSPGFTKVDLFFGSNPRDIDNTSSWVSLQILYLETLYRGVFKIKHFACERDFSL